MSYEIADCRLADLRAIVPALRPFDLAEIAAAGMAPRHLLVQLWRNSFMRRAAAVDGATAAVWGCLGTLGDSEGHPWLFTGRGIEAVPLAFFREARREVRGLLETKCALETGVLRSYAASIRFWQMIGFAVVAEYELGGAEFLRLRMER